MLKTKILLTLTVKDILNTMNEWNWVKQQKDSKRGQYIEDDNLVLATWAEWAKLSAEKSLTILTFRNTIHQTVEYSISWIRNNVPSGET